MPITINVNLNSRTTVRGLRRIGKELVAMVKNLTEAVDRLTAAVDRVVAGLPGPTGVPQEDVDLEAGRVTIQAQRLEAISTGSGTAPAPDAAPVRK